MNLQEFCILEVYSSCWLSCWVFGMACGINLLLTLTKAVQVNVYEFTVYADTWPVHALGADCSWLMLKWCNLISLCQVPFAQRLQVRWEQVSHSILVRSREARCRHSGQLSTAASKAWLGLCARAGRETWQTGPAHFTQHRKYSGASMAITCWPDLSHQQSMAVVIS